MPTLETIRADLAALDDASRILARREIKELPNVLWDDERVKGAVQGRYGRGQGLLVATDRRLVFLDKKLIGDRVRVEDFPYDKVSSIQYQLKFISAEVTIFTSGNRAEITDIIPKRAARTFCESVRATMTKPPEQPAVRAAPQPSSIKEEDVRGLSTQSADDAEFAVILAGIRNKKAYVHVVKVVRTVTGLSLRKVKVLVDNPPSLLKEGIDVEQAQEVRKLLEAAGAIVEVK